jgi:hypothetical protein
MNPFRSDNEETESTIPIALVTITLMCGALFGFGVATASDSILEPAQECSSGPIADQAELNQSVSRFWNRQLDHREQELNRMANRSENMSADDVSITASVVSMKRSNFSSLYNATVRIHWQVPTQRSGGTESITENYSVYVSCDGQYVFQEPTRV